ncbi:hypothetical protein ACLB2K_024773 [Fragaria x ananassa]
MYAETKKAHHALDHAGSFKKLYNSMETMRSASSSFKGKVKRLCSFFETDKLPPPRNVSEETIQSLGKQLRPSKSLVHSNLRGVRRTYEDCYAVKNIFRGFGVWVDESDISVDSAYRKELQRVLGAKNVSLPQVFIKGKYVGGAEVIKQLFETGELAKILQGLPIRKPSGSRKVF